MQVVTQAACAEAYRQVSRVTIGASKLCAGEGTRDTCNGDSGGGLFSRWAEAATSVFLPASTSGVREAFK